VSNAGSLDSAPAHTAPRAVGILGGTFDPVHLGHLALATEALTRLDLAEVRFVPNADPPHKQGQPITPAVHREAMVRLAIADWPSFVLDRAELDRPGPSFAVDTVAVIADQSRREGRPEPWFILASEVLEGFPAWHEPERVIELCRIAVAPRAGIRSVDRSWVTRHYPGHEQRFTFLPGPLVDIAATRIRERLSLGESVSEMVPPQVLEYIVAHGLYQPERGIAA
jgi:nicotinate-nucleotide adenylyltransferase